MAKKETKKEVERKRPSWDEYFTNIVIATVERSSCLRRNVGAIIVKDNMILATGYNGAPRGIESCFEKGYCWRRKQGIPHGRDKDLCLAAHAEQNAIDHAARRGASIEGAKTYVTTCPCPTCAKSIIGSGIIEVIYVFEYHGPQYELSKMLLKEAGIKTRKLKINLEKIAQEKPYLKLR